MYLNWRQKTEVAVAVHILVKKIATEKTIFLAEEKGRLHFFMLI